MKTLVIWDVDGTLTDSKPWIIASYKHAARQAGLPEPSDELLGTMMCGGIYEHMYALFGTRGKEAEQMVRDYRSYYEEHCLHRVEMFAGVREVVEELDRRGVVQAVATMKLQSAAEDLLDRLGISGYMVAVEGADAEGRKTKTQMIENCVAGRDYGRVVMIGDCPTDRRAAEEAGTEFLAAAFGYGYPADKCISEGLEYAGTVGDILRFF